MRAHVIKDGKIVNTIEVDSFDVFPGLVDAALGGQIGDGWVNGAAVPAVLTPAPAPPEPEPTMTNYMAAIQTLLDTKARERNYDGILSACTYATSTFDRFKAEGQACVNWRDAVWAKCYGVMAQVQTGMIPLPSVAALVAMMPALEWPA